MSLSRVVTLRAAALLATGFFATGLGCGGSVRPNVLLITLDTTRADHLSVYGHRRETSPNLDALAAEGVLYRNAHSTSTWTLPSHASLFTGKFPSSHGARYDPEGPLVLSDEIGAGDGIRARGLAPGETTLAQTLTEAGYATAGFAGGPWLLRSFGLAEGFEHWDDEGILGVNGRNAQDLSRAVVAWLETWAAEPGEKPFFIFVNFFDAHFPYNAPTPYAKQFLPPGVDLNPLNRSQFDALYDAEIRFADEHAGVLLDFLRERSLYEDTLVIVTADHGEMLGEHGEWGHNGIPFEPVVRIPLIVKPPGGGPGRSEDQPIQLSDVFHLVLEATGVASSASEREQTQLAEVWHPPDPGTGVWKVLWDGALKYMHHGDGAHRLYDLERDPRERVNRIADLPEDARRLRERLGSMLASLPEPEPPPSGELQLIERETREALERLGYIDDE